MTVTVLLPTFHITKLSEIINIHYILHYQAKICLVKTFHSTL